MAGGTFSAFLNVFFSFRIDVFSSGFEIWELIRGGRGSRTSFVEREEKD